MADTAWIGRIIDGRYAVESVIGAGGMGLVLKAHHKFTGATVALKVLRPEIELDPTLQLRFLAEARAPNAIAHPGIVPVIDAGKAPDGLLYLVMELLVGRPLRIPVARRELSGSEIRRILLELLDVIGAAHERGFVHRDLKPENVFLAGPAATVKLLDFGIAKILDGGAATMNTATGTTLGTPAYMAPEQLDDAGSVDARADLWAIGIMAYEMLTGRLPFRGESMHALLVAIATKEPDPIHTHVPAAPPEVAALFQRALARDRNARFATAGELSKAISGLSLDGAIAPHALPRKVESAVAHAPTSVGHGSTLPAPSTPSDPTAASDPTMPASGPTMATGPDLRPSPSPSPSPSPTAIEPPTATATATATASPAPIRKPAWRLPLAVAAVTLASIGTVAAVIASRSDSSDTAGSGTAAVGASDAIVVATGVAAADAAAVVDAATVARDAAASPTDPAAGHPDQVVTSTPAIDEACKRGCAAASMKCGNVSKLCMRDCIVSSAMRSCLTLPLGSCDTIAICGLKAMCGDAVLQGSGTCAAAANCQIMGCQPNDIACGCRCADTMSPQHAQALAAFDACGINCGFEPQCFQTKCAAQINACNKK